MKVKIYISVGIILLFINSGCNKFLQEFPDYELVGDKAIDDDKSALMALNGAYGYLQLAESSLYGATRGSMPYNVLVEPALRAGLLIGGSGTYHPLQSTLWVDPTVADLKSYYQECYKIINAANNVIYYTEKLPTSKIDEASRVSIISQARFLRGLGHYWVLRSYGYFWDHASPYGVVIREEPSAYSNLQKARSTVEESYVSIIKDFEFCIESGSVAKTSIFKASQNVAKAFLMEVLLIRELNEDNNRIITLADEIIASHDYQLESTFAEAFSLEKHYTASKELIFSRPIDQAGVGDMVGSAGGIYSMFNLGVRNNAFTISSTANGIYSTLIKGDERYSYTWAIMPVITGNPPTEKLGMTLLKAWRQDGQLPSYLMRLAQVHLMKAEALLNRGASMNEVIDIVNIFRARSGNAPLNESELNGDRDLLREALVYEYVLELGMENGCELFAMIRNRGIDGRRMLDRFNNNYIDDMQLALAIPHDETVRDNGIVVQNPLFGN